MSRRPHSPLDRPVAKGPKALAVVTERPAIYDFFGGLGISAWRLDVDAAAIARNGRAIAGAEIAVVDFALHPQDAVATCHALRGHVADIPLAAIICCPYSATPQHIRALAAAGVTAIFDLQVSREDALRTLRATVRGESILRLSFGGRRRATLADVVGGRRVRADDHLMLELVARGLTDNEIGARLHLSPHTVKKRIEYLRDELHVRNRTELAAWAGRQGLYGDERASA